MSFSIADASCLGSGTLSRKTQPHPVTFNLSFCSPRVDIVHCRVNLSWECHIRWPCLVGEPTNRKRSEASFTIWLQDERARLFHSNGRRVCPRHHRSKEKNAWNRESRPEAQPLTCAPLHVDLTASISRTVGSQAAVHSCTWASIEVKANSTIESSDSLNGVLSNNR